MEQRVLTPEEYKALGYVENPNYNPAEWVGGSYSSYTWDVNFLGLPVYRAESKEEFGVDAGTAALKLTAAVLTGGTTAFARVGYSELLRLVN